MNRSSQITNYRSYQCYLQEQDQSTKDEDRIDDGLMSSLESNLCETSSNRIPLLHPVH